MVRSRLFFLRILFFLGFFFGLSLQACRCCPTSYLASQVVNGTLLVRYNPDPAADAEIPALELQSLQVRLRAEICYGRVVLRRAVLVFRPPNSEVTSTAPLTQPEILELLRRGHFLELPILRLPLDFERCNREDRSLPLQQRACFLSDNPAERQEIMLSLELGDASQGYVTPPNRAWSAPCEVAAKAAANEASPPVLMLFAGFLEDDEASFALPPQSGNFRLLCENN